MKAKGHYAQFALMVTLLAAAGVAGAQDTGDTPDEIVVVAEGFRDALKSSIETKEQASQIVDAITAEEMGRFPAANLAEALQGVSGVAMTRDDGAGEFISIRGMAPNMTRVELNGRTVSLTAGSANPDNATTLGFFSPDMFSRVTVIKTPRAIDIEGGVGGTVKLETLRPLDVGANKARAYASWGRNSVKDDPEMNVGGFLNTLFAEERVGLSLGATWADNDRRTDQIESLDGWSEIDAANPALGVYPGRVRQQQRVGDQPRYNVTGTLELRATENTRFWTEFLYAHEDRDELQQRLEVEYARGDLAGIGSLSGDGTALIGDFEDTRVQLNFLDRDRSIEQYGYTLGTDWGNGYWTVVGKVSRSESEEDTLEARARARGNNIDASYDLTDGDALAVTAFPTGSELTDFVSGTPEFPEFDRLDWNLRRIGTEETAFSLDVDRQLDGSFVTGIYFGARYATREVNRRQGDVDQGEITGFVEPGWLGGLAEDDYYRDDAPSYMIRDWVHPDTGPMHQFDGQVESLVVYSPQDTWGLTEDSLAGYFMVDVENDNAALPLKGNLGVRVVDYENEGDGFQTDPNDPGEFIAFRPTDQMTHVLPSFNLRLGLGEQAGRYLRFAAGRVLSRPNPQFIKPTAELSENLDEVSVGNPGLDPYLAWQYDLAYEQYFGETGEGLFSLGVFYKDVDNFFEPATLLGQDLSAYGVDGIGTITTFVNGGTARVTGFETGFQSPFLFLPQPWQNFGIVANYTYVDSERTTVDGTSADFPGTSENSGNAILYFANESIDARLIYNYRDSYLLDQSTQIYVEGGGRLNFALRYTFLENFVASFDVSNLTEATEYSYYDAIVSRFHRRQLEGRRVLVGLSYTFE